MSFDTGLLEQLIEINKRRAPEYLLRLDGLDYAVTDVVIANSRIPVNKPNDPWRCLFFRKICIQDKRYGQ